MQEHAPGLVVFGSNGTGEALAFDCRGAALPVVEVPFIGMNLEDVVPLAASFDEFLMRLTSDDGGKAAPPRQLRQEVVDHELHHIQPMIPGGHPTDRSNLTLVDRKNHIAVVKFWNRTIRDIKKQQQG